MEHLIVKLLYDVGMNLVHVARKIMFQMRRLKNLLSYFCHEICEQFSYSTKLWVFRVEVILNDTALAHLVNEIINVPNLYLSLFLVKPWYFVCRYCDFLFFPSGTQNRLIHNFCSRNS